MTPESSEAPRESLTGIPVEDREAFIAGNAGVLLKDSALYQSTKTSSPELASLAAKYMDLTYVQVETMSMGRVKQLVDDVRSLAASVLAQAEGTSSK